MQKFKNPSAQCAALCLPEIYNVEFIPNWGGKGCGAPLCNRPQPVALRYCFLPLHSGPDPNLFIVKKKSLQHEKVSTNYYSSATKFWIARKFVFKSRLMSRPKQDQGSFPQKSRYLRDEANFLFFSFFCVSDLFIIFGCRKEKLQAAHNSGLRESFASPFFLHCFFFSHDSHCYF